MDKIICHRCSPGIEKHLDSIVWAPLQLVIVDYSPLDVATGHQAATLLQWYNCPTCHHEYFITTKVTDEGVTIR